MKKICILFLLFLCFSVVEAKDKDKGKPRDIDTTPPVGSVQIIPQINGEYIDFTVTATDANGIQAICISNFDTCTTWELYNGAPLFKHWLMLPGSGLRTVYISIMDNSTRVGLTKIFVIKQ